MIFMLMLQTLAGLLDVVIKHHFAIGDMIHLRQILESDVWNFPGLLMINVEFPWTIDDKSQA